MTDALRPGAAKPRHLSRDALSVTLNAVTVVGNHSDQDNSGVGDGGGLATLLLAGSCSVKNAIIANNYKGSGASTADDVSGGIVSGNYNLIESLSGATITGVEPQRYARTCHPTVNS